MKSEFSNQIHNNKSEIDNQESEITTLNSEIMNQKSDSYSEIMNWIPWERNVYIYQLQAWLQEEERLKKK